jgi:hypothetical protein
MKLATRVRLAALVVPVRARRTVDLMPTPVGPAPRDPNDPDFWDWGSDDDEPAVRRHPKRAVVAAVVVVALVLLMVASLR